MRFQGRITTWKDDKGFGFITPNGGGEQVFVHISAISSRQRRPEGNELVSYDLTTDGKGRYQAKSVVLAGEQLSPSHSPSNALPTSFTVFFVFLVVASVVIGYLPFAVLVLYLVASIVAFSAYAFDKSAAKWDQWRIKENTLHLYAIVGGWPGAYVAQRLLRHKSAKPSFQSVFRITVALNSFALGIFLVASVSGVVRLV